MCGLCDIAGMKRTILYKGMRAVARPEDTAADNSLRDGFAVVNETEPGEEIDDNDVETRPGTS